jgi:hypothetical protein
VRVYSKVEPTWLVTKRGYRDGRPAKFRAFPPATNKIDAEQAFETEADLAVFLKANPDWKSYFRDPKGNQRNQHLTNVL